MNENKAEDIKILNLKKINNSVTDYFVLCTGKSTTQIDAIADNIEEKVSKKFSEKPWKKEGKINKEWILIDFVNVVVSFIVITKEVSSALRVLLKKP